MPQTPCKKTLDIENSRGYPPRGSFFPQNSRSSPRAYRGAGRRQKSQLYGATDFLSKIWQHTITVCFVSALILVFAWKSENAFRHNFVHFQHVHVQNFRDSESLGKGNGKKGSHFLKLLTIYGVKSPCKKKVTFCANLASIRRLCNKDQEVIQQGSRGY